jgi:hypothetical protein
MMHAVRLLWCQVTLLRCGHAQILAALQKAKYKSKRITVAAHANAHRPQPYTTEPAAAIFSVSEARCIWAQHSTPVLHGAT